MIRKDEIDKNPRKRWIAALLFCRHGCLRCHSKDKLLKLIQLLDDGTNGIPVFFQVAQPDALEFLTDRADVSQCGEHCKLPFFKDFQRLQLICIGNAQILKCFARAAQFTAESKKLQSMAVFRQLSNCGIIESDIAR